jgi:cysteine desulfurase
MDRIYLDNNATTKPDPRVCGAIKEALEISWGNPSSLHWYGQNAKKILETAREDMAGLVNADPLEVHFTSGGTEADNMAIMGATKTFSEKGKRIVTSSIEHPAVLAACRDLADKGFEIVEVPVDKSGRVDPADIEKAITDNTILVTVMAANNETGVIQPISEIGNIAKEAGALFHTDAVQCTGKIDINVKDWPVDMVSFSGHKFYGPKGVGALWIKKGLRIQNSNLGGSQEMGMRGGTENIPGMAGMGMAAKITKQEMAKWNERIKSLRDYFENEVQKNIAGVTVHGDTEHRVPNTTNMSFEGAEGEAVLINLDLKGIAVSTGSACSSGAASASHVLVAMGLTQKECETSIRFSLGKDNTKKEIEKAVKVLTETIERIRSISQ